MPELETNEPVSLSRMPCVAVLVTLGFLSTIHLGSFFSDGSLQSDQSEKKLPR